MQSVRKYISLGLLPCLLCMFGLLGCGSDTQQPDQQGQTMQRADEQEEVQVCVDKDQNVVDEKSCEQAQAGQQTVAESGGTRHSSGIPLYVWYWILTRPGTRYTVGSRVSGGSTAPRTGFATRNSSPARSYSPSSRNGSSPTTRSSPSSVSRGGFGGGGHASGGSSS